MEELDFIFIFFPQFFCLILSGQGDCFNKYVKKNIFNLLFIIKVTFCTLKMGKNIIL